MTPAQIQTLIDACRTSPADLVTWLELKAVLEALKNQDLGLTLTTTGTSGPATLDIDNDILNIPNYSTDLTVYVPYTGANQNVNLGEYGIRSGWYQFDLTPTGTPVSASTMYWDDNQKTVALVMGGTTQKIGHDQFYHAKNSTGTTIPKGTAVRFAGTDGGSGHLLITPFLADGSNPSSYFMGVTAEEITNGSFGKVQSFGRLDGIDTSAFAEGDILYASTTVAGGFQTTVPQAPNNIVQVAAVVSDSNNGKLLIRPTLGSKLTSDESVKLTSVANGNVLQYNSTLAVWENVAPSSLAVSNIYTANGTITANRTITLSTFSLTIAGTGSHRFHSNGNIGINTTTDAGFRLDVNGTMRVQGTITTNNFITFTNSSNSGLNPSSNTVSIECYGGRDVTNAYRFGYLNDMNVSNSTRNFFTFGETFLTYTYFGGTNIGRIINFSHIINTTGGSNTITAIYYNPTLTSTTGTTHRFLHNETGDVLFGTTSGNVGIGTTSPTYKLHTVGTGRITGNVELSVDSGAYTFIGATGDTSYRLSVDGDLRVYGNIRTAQPTGGTGVGAWRLGSTATGTFTLDATTCVEIEIGGSLVKLATVS